MFWFDVQKTGEPMKRLSGGMSALIESCAAVDEGTMFDQSDV